MSHMRKTLGEYAQRTEHILWPSIHLATHCFLTGMIMKTINFEFCWFLSHTGKSKVELTYDRMFTVTSWLRFTVTREDDGVPVVCIVDHPAVKDFQAQKYLEVQCE